MKIPSNKMFNEFHKNTKQYNFFNIYNNKKYFLRTKSAY